MKKLFGVQRTIHLLVWRFVPRQQLTRPFVLCLSYAIGLFALLASTSVTLKPAGMLYSDRLDSDSLNPSSFNPSSFNPSSSNSSSFNLSSSNPSIEGVRASPYPGLSTFASPQYHAQCPARYAQNDDLLNRDANRPLVDPLPVSEDSLTGFIVADAHFGWDDAKQPANETIRDRMHHINKRFPNLDVFWDAGDAHHNADDNERSDWLTYLAGEIPQTPFYFTAGNHEVDNYSGPYDPEERAQQLGSVNVRPYYSVDIKNIHIISLPQLIHVNYLSAESLAWLKLDLQLNQDKTVIIISHNALTGTTSTDDGSIYREVVNSDAMFDLMRQYPNIRAWVHGHNHNYKVVQQDGTLFVSAGRMGGFNGDRNTDLRLGDDNLGGIYFKVDQNTLTIRAYNASKQQFMDQLGYPGLSKTLRFKTSLDADAPARLSYGYGLVRDGQRIPGYNHHLNASQRELFISGSPDAVFNDNSKFTSFQEEDTRGQLLNAIHVRPRDGYQWLDPKIRLLPKPSGKSTIVDLTNGARTRWTYYRAAPKRNYMAVLKLDAVEGNQQVRLQARVRDNEGNIVRTLRAKSWQLTDDPQTLRYPFKVPALRKYPSIYTDLTSDRQLQLSIEAKFRDMDHPVILKAFKLRLKGSKKTTENPALIIHRDPNGAQAGTQTYQHNGLLGVDDYARFNLPTHTPQRSVFEASAQGSGLLTFLVRETGLQWQVRNGTWLLGKMRIF